MLYLLPLPPRDTEPFRGLRFRVIERLMPRVAIVEREQKANGNSPEEGKGCTSMRRWRREKALDNHLRFTEAILLRVIYCPSFASLFCWPTSPSFSQIDQDDICVLLQA